MISDDDRRETEDRIALSNSVRADRHGAWPGYVRQRGGWGR
jgi:hypothetical protein